jgi:glycosyltransferase involved in cell wall biosynthesis
MRKLLGGIDDARNVMLDTQEKVAREVSIALLPWGAVLEDFLDPLGVSIESFCNEFRGSWMFGYVDALHSAGIRTVLICISKQIKTPSRFVHRPTGATIWFLPTTKLYRTLHRRMVYPYGQTVREAFGEIRSWRRLLYPLYAIAREAGLYLSTPHTSLARVVRRESCDAILCQEYEYPRFDTCVLLGKLINRSVFGCFQGGNYHHNHLERLVRGHSIRACAGLITPTESEERRVIARYNVSPRHLARIFNPVDTDVWRPSDRYEARAALGIPDHTWVVAWHGRVALHKKGLDVLLDAWEHVCSAHMDRELRLLLVGTGDDADRLVRRLASVENSTIFWDNRFLHDQEIVRRYLSAADVYVFPSRYEGLPVALLEAMACGLPVVATEFEGVAEILDGSEDSGGLLVPQGDSEALAAAIGRLLFDSDWRFELGNRARRTVVERFSLEPTGERLRTFLRVGSSPPGADPAGVGGASKRSVARRD